MEIHCRAGTVSGSISFADNFFCGSMLCVLSELNSLLILTRI